MTPRGAPVDRGRTTTRQARSHLRHSEHSARAQRFIEKAICAAVTEILHKPQRGFMHKQHLILALLFAFAGSQALTQKAHAENAPRHVEVTAKRFAFVPAEITLKKGEPVDLVLKSTDVQHGLRFRELHVDVRVGKGGTSEVHFTP